MAQYKEIVVRLRVPITKKISSVESVIAEMESDWRDSNARELTPEQLDAVAFFVVSKPYTTTEGFYEND